METLLFVALFVGINVFAAWQKQKKKHVKERSERGQEEKVSPEPKSRPASPLEELLRKFEEAQAEMFGESKTEGKPFMPSPETLETKKEPLREEHSEIPKEVPKPFMEPILEGKSSEREANAKQSFKQEAIRPNSNKKTSESKRKNWYPKEPKFNETPVQIHLNHEQFRQGFLWAKIIDEPRFRNKWSPRPRV